MSLKKYEKQACVRPVFLFARRGANSSADLCVRKFEREWHSLEKKNVK